MNIARTLTSLSGLALLSVLSAACGIGAEDEFVSPTVEVIDHTKSAITASGLAQINGTYLGCAGHLDTDTWSVGIASSVSAEAQLQVRKNDTACQLVLTEIVNGATTYDTASDITMSTDWKLNGSAFNSGGTLAFYGNAMQSSMTYAADFQISLLISDEPTASATAQDAEYAMVQESSVSSENVAPPAYTLSLASFSFLTDTGDVIDSFSGNVALSTTGQTGEYYVVTSTDVGSSPTFADVDAAYTAGTPVAFPGDGNIDAATAFNDAVGADLTAAPASRWILVKHEANGVRSFQVFKLTFNKVGGYN